MHNILVSRAEFGCRFLDGHIMGLLLSKLWNLFGNEGIYYYKMRSRARELRLPPLFVPYELWEFHRYDVLLALLRRFGPHLTSDECRIANYLP
jgi:hypothetical protein